MDIQNLASLESGHVLEADLVIIGAGPAGLSIARAFANSGVQVLVLESGLLEQDPAHTALLELESIGGFGSDAQKQKRRSFHGANSHTWRQEQQPFGVRCRAFGGSSHAWFGKSAPFDPIDFAARPWVADSGWPFDAQELEPYVERALRALNLGTLSPPGRFDREGLSSFYWQFARSRIDRFDIMRFGAEFLTLDAPNIRVLLNATAVKLQLDADGGALQSVEVASIEGRRCRVRGKATVLAASAIDNCRLLLASSDVHPTGVGNRHDVVGRYLMDHAGTRVARVPVKDMPPLVRTFGFYGVREGDRTNMFMHGLALTPQIQAEEQLLNAALYFAADRAPDDPWGALKRLLKSKSPAPMADAWSVIRGSGLLTRGAAIKLLASGAIPNKVKDIVIGAAIRLNPNLVAEEFQAGGLPHKLTGLSVDAISEQAPDRESRVTLSDRRDPLGVPLAKVDWRINEAELRTLVAVAHRLNGALAQAGLPVPRLEEWVERRALGDAVIIDMAHTLGTTRMSDDPRRGVVDGDCRVHGVRGLYVAGGSTFPTSGHANPTLMIVAVALRLADTLKRQLEVQAA